MQHYDRFGNLKKVNELSAFFERVQWKGTEFPRIVLAGKTEDKTGKSYRQTLVHLETKEDWKEFLDVVRQAEKLVKELPERHTLLEDKKGTKCSCGCSVVGNFCPNCGKAVTKPEPKPTCCGIEVTGKFCTQCGKAVGTVPTVPTTPAANTDSLDSLGDIGKKRAVKRSK